MDVAASIINAAQEQGSQQSSGADDPAPVEGPWPDPPDEAAFYGLAGDIVRAIDPHTEADRVAVLLHVLVMFGSVIGRAAHYVVGGGRHYTNLFTVLVGPTSKGRKGTALSDTRRIFALVAKEWVDDRIRSGLSSGEGLIWAVRDPIEKQEAVRVKGRPTGEYVTVVADHGVVDKRLLIIEEEFASVLRMFQRDGNTLSPVIRQAWDSGKLSTLTKNSPAKASGAHVSIIGHVTRDELRRYFDTTEAGNGFGNRFLWACVRRSKLLPDGGRFEDVDLGGLSRRLAQAITFAKELRALVRDGEAREMWHAVYAELSEGRPGLLGAVVGRAEAQALRLALTYALLDSSATIKPAHLEAALALIEFCEASARHVFGGKLGDAVADEILVNLRRRSEGMTRSELRDLFGRHITAERLTKALSSLVTKDLVRSETETTPGRSAERWFATKVAS